MNYKDYIIKETQASMDAIFRTARATPADKLSWKVEGKGRTIMDQLQEVATTPLMFVSLLTTRTMAPDTIENMKNLQATAASIEECEQLAKTNTQTLIEAINNFPDDELHQEIEMPGSGGQQVSFADIMGFQHWNNAYHRAQICFIQTLYGDGQMH